MHHFNYKNGVLCCEDVPLETIAEQVGTPVYVYSSATLTRHFHVIRQALSQHDCLVAYAVKANSNMSILRLLARLGAGADIVSGGELARALAAGIAADKIVFSGVGKQHDEIIAAIEAGIGMFNIESRPELLRISALAEKRGLCARIGFRVNPQITAGAHTHIATGRAEDKFGVGMDEVTDLYAEAAALPGIKVTGIAVHIGSQIVDIAPMREAFSQLASLTRKLKGQGHEISMIDLGGGLAIPYSEHDRPDPPSAYGAMVSKTMAGLDNVCIIVEPGRIIVGNAGILLTGIEYIKQRHDHNFAILDAGMNDLPRPAIYGARHEILTIAETDPAIATMPYDIVGPICESGDSFARDYLMPPLQTGQKLAIMSAGAYCSSMASQYNSRPLLPEVLVLGDRFAIVRTRPDFSRMIMEENYPDWF